MTNVKLGRSVGLLLLMNMVASVVVNFVWLAPVFKEPGFLVNAAAHPIHMGLSACVGLAAGALFIAIAILAWPLFRRYTPMLTMWLLVLSAISLSLAALESAGVLSLLSLSQAYAKAETANADTFEIVRGVVASARNWAHYIHLIIGGSAVFVLFLLLNRSALVPRLLSGFGMLAALLQMTVLTAPLFGGAVAFNLLLPLGLAHLATTAWLLAKGFVECNSPMAGAHASD